MKVLCVIPSRLQSTRLPKKPLLPIQGKPMVQWVYENASRCSKIDQVVVATDHKDIEKVITDINGTVIMTDSNIPTGSERAAFVAEQYPEMDVIINLQGDEPFIKPSMLEKLIEPYLNGQTPEMTTLAYPLDPEKYHDPGTVKVVTDLNGRALYFSRAPIPYYRTEHKAPVYNHMGLYAFRRDFLLRYKDLPQTPLELTESLEQLRVMEHGYPIQVCFCEDKTLEINTEEEYQRAQHFIYQD